MHHNNVENLENEDLESGIVINEKFVSGYSGSIFAGNFKNHPEIKIAIKFFKAQTNTYANLDIEKKFLERASNFNSPYFVKYFGSKKVNVENFLNEALVFEYMPQDLYVFCCEKKENFSLSLEIALQVCEGINTMHNAGYVHCDLKIENVLLKIDSNNNVEAKLCDFGFTRKMDDENTKILIKENARRLGTPEYIAPEIILAFIGFHCPEYPAGNVNPVFTAKSDLYSFAILLYELFTKLPAYSPGLGTKKKCGLSKVLFKVIEGERPSLSSEKVSMLDGRIIGLFQTNWKSNPVKRLTTEETLEQLREIKRNYP